MQACEEENKGRWKTKEGGKQRKVENKGRWKIMSDLMSDGFIEAKRVYAALLIACIACFVLSTENRKKTLRRAPSRANRIELRFELFSLMNQIFLETLDS